jgi:chaperonin GroEL (HSP60 family)
VVDEVYRTINDAVHTTVNAYHNFVLPGGGATEVEVAQRLRKYGFRDKTKRQLAIFAFAQSLEGITKILAQNSGLDALSVLLELRSEHSKSKGKKYYGLDVITGEVGDMMERGIIEPLKTKKQIIEGAMETALLILRADDYIPKKGLLGVEEELIKADIAEAIAAGKAREDVEHIYREAVKMFGREHVRDAIKLHGWDDVKKITGILTGKES